VLAMAEEMLKADPRSAGAMVMKGRVLLAQGKTPEALPLLQSAVSTRPDSVQARFYLGLAHLQSNNRQAAESEWVEAARNPGRFAQP